MSNSDDDLSAFRDAVRGATPIHTDRAPASQPKPTPKARFSRADNKEVLDEALYGNPDPSLLGTGDELFYMRSTLPREVLRKLKRGSYRIDAELDLHGCTLATARTTLDAFLSDCRAHGWRCVRIIHGKGKRSGHGGPVLKPSVAHWLRKRDLVQAFSSARPVDGGSGALYVLLKR